MPPDRLFRAGAFELSHRRTPCFDGLGLRGGAYLRRAASAPTSSPHRRATPASRPKRSSARPREWVDDLLHRRRARVEGGHRRHHHRPHLGQREHRAQVPGVQGGLSHEEHEATTLLENDVGGAGEQRRSHPARDLRHGAHRARRDDHSERLERARGDGGADVPDGVTARCELLDLGRLAGGLVADRHLRRPRHHEVSIYRHPGQDLKEPDPVDDPRGAAHPHHEALRGAVGGGG